MTYISKTYTHPDFGELRTMYDGEMLWLCAKDIGRILGYKEPEKSVKYHCPNMMKHAYPPEEAVPLYFINAEEVDYLLGHTESANALPLSRWICNTIIEDIFHGSKTEDTDAEDEEVEGIFLIHAQDYCDHVRNLMMMSHYLYHLAEAVKDLPDHPANRYIRDYADIMETHCAEILETYGFDFRDLEIINTEKLDALFEQEVITPKEAGYYTAEQLADMLQNGISDLLADIFDTDA